MYRRIDTVQTVSQNGNSRHIISQGGTILAISHDDRYFHVADRLLTMREGGFVEEPADQGAQA